MKFRLQSRSIGRWRVDRSVTHRSGYSTRGLAFWNRAKIDVLKAGSATLRFCGYSSLFVVIAIGGFFAYDATTYHPRGIRKELSISQLALSPLKGGAKNLPIADVLLDDQDTPEAERSRTKPKLVILGSGWASVSLLNSIKPEEYHIVLISPMNYFLFTPLLPSATVGTINIRSLIEPIRKLTQRVRAHFIHAKAVNVDFSAKLVECSAIDSETGQESQFYVPYDKLVIGVGCTTNTHGVPGTEHCHLLKDVSDARSIRNHILDNCEHASLPSTTEEERKRLMSFVICGGGPTGVEFAAELIEAFQEDIAPHYPQLISNHARVTILQSADHILNTYDRRISDFAEKKFSRDEIDVVLNARVTSVTSEVVNYTTRSEDGKISQKSIPGGIVLWSTGIGMTELTQNVISQLQGSQKNKRAIETDSHLRVLGAPLGDVYSFGDCSTVQNNVTESIMGDVRKFCYEKDIDPRQLSMNFQQWRVLAKRLVRRFPQASGHVRRLDELFKIYDKDKTDSLEYDELQELLEDIDKKLTSLPATAQRAHQQGSYLAKKLNAIAKASPSLLLNGINEGDIDDAVYEAFSYRHLGSLAYLGNSAVIDTGSPIGTFTGGLIAMYLWRSVYFSQQSFKSAVLSKRKVEHSVSDVESSSPTSSSTRVHTVEDAVKRLRLHSTDDPGPIALESEPIERYSTTNSNLRCAHLHSQENHSKREQAERDRISQHYTGINNKLRELAQARPKG